MNGGRKMIVWAVVAVVLATAGWWLYQDSKSATQSQETGPIKLGYIAPLTGDASSIGTVTRATMELAVEEINAAGGVSGRQIEVVYEDGRCNASAATSAANKLMNVDGVVAIIGGLCSSETAAFAPAAMRNKTIILSPGSSAPNLSDTGKYFFRNYPSDAYQGRFAAEYAYETLGAREIAVIYHISDWGTGIKNVFAERFEELGGEIAVEEGAPQEARDYRTQLTKVKAADADLIYSPTYPEGATAMLKQAKEIGITTRLLGGDGWADTKLQEDVSGLGEMLYIESKADLTDSFKNKMEAQGLETNVFAATTYDAAYIIAQAIEKTGTDPDKLADAIRATKYDGVSGYIEFDENGDLVDADYIVKRIENGSAVLVE